MRMQHVGAVAGLLWSLSMPVWAKDTLAIAGEAGVTTASMDDAKGAFQTMARPYIGARAEVNLLVHAKMDVRGYLLDRGEEGEPAPMELSLSGSGPSLIPVKLDLHELYWRSGPRLGAPLLYGNVGAAVGLPFLGALKLGAGLSVVRGRGTTDAKHTGAYLGAEHRFSIDKLDTVARGTWTLLPSHAGPTAERAKGRITQGFMLDVDAMWKVDVGAVTVGPRIDLTYRNLDLSDRVPLGALPAEVRATLGAAVRWGGVGL